MSLDNLALLVAGTVFAVFAFGSDEDEEPKPKRKTKASKSF